MRSPSTGFVNGLPLVVLLCVELSICAPGRCAPAPPTRAQVLRSVHGLAGGGSVQQSGPTAPLGPKLPAVAGPLHPIVAGPTFKLLPLDWNNLIYLTLGQPVAANQWPAPGEQFAALGMNNVSFGPSDATAVGSVAQLGDVLPPTGAVQVNMANGSGSVFVAVSNPPLGSYAITVWVTGTGQAGLGMVVATSSAPPMVPETSLATSLDGLNIGAVLKVQRTAQYWVSFRSSRPAMWRVAGVSVMKLAQ
jgi:hypothetical protein